MNSLYNKKDGNIDNESIEESDNDSINSVNDDDDDSVNDSDNDIDNDDENDGDIDGDNKLKDSSLNLEENIVLQNIEGNIKNILQPEVSNLSDDDSDDDDEYSKLDNSRMILQNTHKNLESINYIEVEKLTKITRDADNQIIDQYHTTLPILSKYERTKILGLRTKQINSGNIPFINVDEDIIDGFIIAEKELNQKKIPFIIKRPISYNKFEYWKLEDLEIV